jgi:hypothetical protein
MFSTILTREPKDLLTFREFEMFKIITSTESIKNLKLLLFL